MDKGVHPAWSIDRKPHGPHRSRAAYAVDHHHGWTVSGHDDVGPTTDGRRIDDTFLVRDSVVGDRNGLLVALVQHLDETLDLDKSLAHVLAATTGVDLLERTMRLNHDFWTAVQPVAQVLEAAQYDDEALGAAWRDRMQFRQMAFRMMVQRLADIGDLAPQWTIEDASDLLYGVAHFDTWRELIRHVGWTDDHYVDAMARLLCRALLER